MKYTIIIEKAAKKFIISQPPKIQKQLYETISQLPAGNDIVRLQGFKVRYRARCGTMRIVFDRYDDIITIRVVAAGNRGDIYKHL